MVVAFEKTERSVACDESFYVKHEVQWNPGLTIFGITIFLV